MFNNFRYEREIGDRAVVREIVRVQGGFLEKRRDNRFLKGRKKVAGAEREINNVGDSMNENRRTFFKKPGW